MRCVFNDRSLGYDELLQKANMCSLELGRLQSIALEVYKIKHDMNPVYLSDLIIKRTCKYNTRQRNNLSIPTVKTLILTLIFYYVYFDFKT